MKKTHTTSRLLARVAAIFLITLSSATAADKVVVISLESGSGDTGRVRTVTSATGRIWMDRNLGAHRAAIKSDDSQAYGSLYQWGRLGDGHEYRESPTTTTLSTDDVPGHGHFIMNSNSPYDWMASKNNFLWLGASGINNPCPAGFSLPTDTEWNNEIAFWGSDKAAGAFASPLRLVFAGYRDLSGTVGLAGSGGLYWSRTVSVNNSRSLYFGSGNANTDSNNRAYGMSVRCIKEY